MNLLEMILDKTGLDYIRTGEGLAGIGAWGRSLKYLDIPHKLQWYYEIDKYASNAFAAIHDVSEDLNRWDIFGNKENLEDIDVFYYSPPCQSFSLAGKREGTDVAKGTIFWECLEIIKLKKPFYSIMENVEGLTHEAFKYEWAEMQRDIRNAGYVNYPMVLNTQNYGIPQNRSRIFLISIREDIDKEMKEQGIYFTEPKTVKLELRLKDLLEDAVDKKYYLSDKMVDFFYSNEQKNKEKGNGFRFGVSDGNIVASAITTRNGSRMDDNFIKVPCDTKKGYMEAYDGDGIYLDRPEQKRGTVQSGMIPTLKTSGEDIGVVVTDKIIKLGNLSTNDRFGGDPQDWRLYSPEGICPTIKAAASNGYIKERLRIRKLTPLETFRLQHFSDDDYYKAVESYEKKWGKDKSDTQMYIRTGNSISVNVINEIHKNLLLGRQQVAYQSTMFDYMGGI